MPIDPNIALGAKPVEIQDPLNNYMKAVQIQNIQNDNALNQLKYQDANNMLGYNIQKAKALTLKDQADVQKAQGDLVDAAMKRSQDELKGVTTAEDFKAWHQRNHQDPVLGPYLASRGITPQDSSNRIDAAVKNGTFPQMLSEASLGIEKARQMHYQEQNLGGTIRTLAIPEYATPGVKATVVPNSVGTVTPKPKDEDFKADEKKLVGTNIISNMIDTLNGKIGAGYTGTGSSLMNAITDTNPATRSTGQKSFNDTRNILADSITRELTGRTSATSIKLMLNTIPKLTDTLDQRKASIGALKQMVEDVKNGIDITHKEYSHGASVTPGTPSTTPVATFPKAPAIGTIIDGHKYMGGDPAQPGSWKKQ